MTNFSNTLASHLGYCRSGREFWIPYDLLGNDVEAFIESYSIEDQIDIYCVTEYCLYRNLKLENQGLDAVVIDLIYQYLHGKADMPPFAPKLGSMKLHTSIDRVTLGRSLAL